MSTKAIEEVGLIVGIVGALILAWGSLIIVWAGRSYSGPSETHHRREKWAHLIGGLFIAVGFGASLYRLLQK